MFWCSTRAAWFQCKHQYHQKPSQLLATGLLCLFMFCLYAIKIRFRVFKNSIPITLEELLFYIAIYFDVRVSFFSLKIKKLCYTLYFLILFVQIEMNIIFAAFNNNLTRITGWCTRIWFVLLNYSQHIRIPTRTFSALYKRFYSRCSLYIGIHMIETWEKSGDNRRFIENIFYAFGYISFSSTFSRLRTAGE